MPMQNPWFGNSVTCKESKDAESSENDNSGIKGCKSFAGRSPLPDTKEKSESVSAMVSDTVSCLETTMHGFGSFGSHERWPATGR